MKTNQPKEIFAVDSSNTFISSAEQSINSSIIRFQVGIAQALDLKTNSVDAVVSGIMLNFVPQPETAIAEMMRVTKPDGQIGIFLWDYANGMEMLRYFWDAAIVLDESAKKFDEGNRFPLCKQGELESLVKKTNLKQIELKSIKVTTKFQNFDDYWTPFLGNVGPAPSYNMSLSPKNRQQIENKLRKTLPIADDGSISMIAKAWAVKGTA